ncbi:Uncharacterised protein [Parabacteroides distasonis]|uniref:Uncharacterized protein n=1 Tax=Parabacteroides distasonis TaxID=823 RepID=A0A6N3A8K6_PARDI|nr:hypothetical protein HMPREF0127_00410 [Bacteroides sp. 1_1_30]
MFLASRSFKSVAFVSMLLCVATYQSLTVLCMTGNNL